MARKKQEIALQLDVGTQNQWEAMLRKEGLVVVDVYQAWSGPCKAMLAFFKRLNNEIGTDLLSFAVAKSDTIDALERYRGKCEPCFLLYAGGCLVSVLRGINCPLIMKTVSDQLAHETRVLEGKAERNVIRDTSFGDEESAAEEVESQIESRAESAGEDDKRGVTVAILKPNLVAEGKVEEVVEHMKEAGIDILHEEERILSEDEAKEFYSHQQDQEFFEDLVKYMSSGPSHILVLSKGDTGEGIIEEWRELIGPVSVEEARSSAPGSLRAKYGGEENYVNSLHGSNCTETAMKELAFFLPEFVVPSKSSAGRESQTPAAPQVQRTLALIRPDAMRERKASILAKITEAGFAIAMQKEMHLTKAQAEEFYKEHKEQEYFEELTTRMSRGPLLALALAREDAVTGWRTLLGPTDIEKAKEEAPDSLRAQFLIEDSTINQLHGSDTESSAQKELEYFFPPVQQTVAVIKPDAYQSKDEIMNKIKEAGFHVAARKETEMTHEIVEQFYGEHKDKEYFEELTQHMTSGPTLFMVLSKEDAVEGWRSMIGPTCPEKAKEHKPESLRAQYGTDIKANALHGSSTTEHAEKIIKVVFGDMELSADGTVKCTEEAVDLQQQEAPPTPESQEQASDKQEEKGTEEVQGSGETPVEQKEESKSPEGEASSVSQPPEAGEEKPPEGEEQKASETSGDKSPEQEGKTSSEQSGESPEAEKSSSPRAEKSPTPEAEKSPPEIENTPTPEPAKSPSPEAEKSPPETEKSPPETEKTPTPEPAKSPSPEAEKSPSEPEKSPSPEAEKSPTPGPEQSPEAEESPKSEAEKSPTPAPEKSPSLEAEKSPEPSPSNTEEAKADSPEQKEEGEGETKTPSPAPQREESSLKEGE